MHHCHLGVSRRLDLENCSRFKQIHQWHLAANWKKIKEMCFNSTNMWCNVGSNSNYLNHENHFVWQRRNLFLVSFTKLNNWMCNVASTKQNSRIKITFQNKQNELLRWMENDFPWKMHENALHLQILMHDKFQNIRFKLLGLKLIKL